MRQADVIAITTASLFAIWLVRTGRARRFTPGTSSDPVIQAFEATGGFTGSYGPFLPKPTLPSQKGQAILERARASLGQPTSVFNPQYPRRACASYVSSVLVSLGLLNAGDPRCTGLMSKLPGAGAEKVASGPAGLTQTRIGDIVFFRDALGKLRHVEIAGGAGSSVGTSSSQQKVGERPIGSRGYPSVEVWRF